MHTYISAARHNFIYSPISHFVTPYDTVVTHYLWHTHLVRTALNTSIVYILNIRTEQRIFVLNNGDDDNENVGLPTHSLFNTN